jgi:tetratricopeptide (TPR) repeat protein
MNDERRTGIFGDWRKIAIIFGIALVVRLVYLIAASSGVFFDNPTGDPAFYDLWAKSILNDSLFPDTTFYRAPLYPYFVSILYAISGSSKLFVGIIQIILGSMSCALVYLIARRFTSEKASLAAGIIASLYGVFIYLDTELVPNTLAAFLFLSGIFILTLTRQESPLRPYLLSGILIGLASTAQPSMIVFGFVALFWFVFGFKGRASRKLSRWGMMLAGMALAIMPVTLHNAFRSGDFILISSNLGTSFLAGNNIKSDGKSAQLPGQSAEVMWDYDAAKNLAESISGEELSPAGVSAFYLKQAWTFIEASPKEAFGLIAKRKYMAMNGYEISSDRPFYFQSKSSWLLSTLTWDRIISFPMGLLIPLFVIGIISTLSSWKKQSLLYCFFVSAFIWPAMFYVNIQTRAPMAFPIIIFASVGLFAVIRFIKEKEFPRLATAIVVGLIVLFVSNYDFVDVKERPDRAYLQIGLMYWNKGDLTEAEKAFQAGLTINPDSPLLLNNLGNIYYKKRIYPEAEKKYRRALLLDEYYMDARKNLIRLYERGEREDMLPRSYLEFLDHFPNSEWGLFRMAEYYVERLQNDSALVYYAKLLALNPDNPDARFATASIYAKTGRPDEARQIYEEMLQIYPEEPKLHLNLGLAFLKLGKTIQAEDEFNTALYYDSVNTYAIYNIARMLESRGDTATATSMFLRIMTIDPGFFENSQEILDSLIAGTRYYDQLDQDTIPTDKSAIPEDE